MKRILLTVALCALAAPAFAYDIHVTGYDLPDNPDAFGAGTILGYSYYDGPVNLHVEGGPDIIAYCGDLNHVLHADYYNYGLLTENGLGNPISELLSNRIGHLASAGFAALAVNDGQLAAADQLLIWSLEYGVPEGSISFNTGLDPNIQSDFDFLAGLSFANTGRATVIIPEGYWPGNPDLSQQMVIGFSTGVPEPSTWAMGLMGFGLVGALGWRRSRRSVVLA